MRGYLVDKSIGDSLRELIVYLVVSISHIHIGVSEDLAKSFYGDASNNALCRKEVPHHVGCYSKANLVVDIVKLII